MAVDKKSDYVGNHGGAYTDGDGMRKQFTIIDHDVKTKISTGASLPSEALEEIKQEIASYRQHVIESILSYPAALCPVEFSDFTLRSEDIPTIIWNEAMIKDPGMSTDRLRDLEVMVSNRAEMKKIIT